MATECFTPVRGKIVRVTQLDECGEVGTSYVVSDGFITVSMTAENETGDEFIQKNANGALCVNERSPDSLKRLNVTVDWCLVDPDLISIITGYPLELDGTSPGDDVVGFRWVEGEVNASWALEVWTGLANAACAEGEVCYGYLLVPFITGSQLSGVTVENAAATFQTTGYTQSNSGWGVGPWDVIHDPAAPLDEAIAADEHALLRTTCVAPPVSVCGAQVVS
jgi:hypothetical protein